MITKDKLEKLACIYIDLLGCELSHSSREQVVLLGVRINLSLFGRFRLFYDVKIAFHIITGI